MNIDYFKRQNLVLKPETGDKIRNTKIAFFGCGAATNELAKNLALMGFGCKALFVDFDTVEDSNLSKSTMFTKEDIGKAKAQVMAERFKEYSLHESPKSEFIVGNAMTDVGKSVFWEYDIFFSCVDTKDCRVYLSDWCVRAGKPFFEIGFKNFNLNISFFAPQDDGSYPICLRELMGQGSFDGARKSCSGLKIKDDNLQVIPTIQCTAALSGALVAMELVKFLDGNPSLLNKTLFYYGNIHESMVIKYDSNPLCKIHDEAFMPIRKVRVKPNATALELVSAVQKATGLDIVKLPEEFIFAGRCSACGQKMLINRRKSQVFDHERWCEDCRESPNHEKELSYGNQWDSVTEISTASEPSVLSKTLRELGIPKNDVLEAKGVKGDDIVVEHILIQEMPPLKIKLIKDSEPIDFSMDANTNYADASQEDLKNLCEIQKLLPISHLLGNSDFTALIKKSAMDAFEAHAKKLYESSKSEASGIIVGYYGTNPIAPNRKIAVGTEFFPSTGDATKVTCEISADDICEVAKYCEKHKLLPIIWIHSHPGFGAFYSNIDIYSLSHKFNGAHQYGIVVDFIKNESKAYKALENNVNVEQINYYVYDIVDESILIMQNYGTDKKELLFNNLPNNKHNENNSHNTQA